MARRHGCTIEWGGLWILHPVLYIVCWIQWRKKISKRNHSFLSNAYLGAARWFEAHLVPWTLDDSRVLLGSHTPLLTPKKPGWNLRTGGIEAEAYMLLFVCAHIHFNPNSHTLYEWVWICNQGKAHYNLHAWAGAVLQLGIWPKVLMYTFSAICSWECQWAWNCVMNVFPPNKMEGPSKMQLMFWLLFVMEYLPFNLYKIILNNWLWFRLAMFDHISRQY